MASTISRQLLSDQIYEYLLAELAFGRLPIGSNLNSLKIAEELDVSRTPVDRAITRLVGAELVRYDENRQPVVVALPSKASTNKAAFEFTNQTDRAYNALLDKIIRRELEPGQTINEAPIAQELRLNRTSIHRAAERLHADGLLLRLPRRGWQIVCLNQSDASEIHLMRQLLEPIVVENVVKHIDQVTLDELMRETDKMLTKGENADPLERRLIDLKFHCTLSECSGHRMIAETLAPLFRKLILTMKLDDRVVSQSYLEHKAILNAIIKRDKKKAVKAMNDHLNKSAQRVQNLFPAEDQQK